jgi:hypothetical protein
MSKIKHISGLKALTPLFIFIALYLLCAIIAKDFYKLPVTVSFLIASVSAIMMTRGESIEKRISIFTEGAGQNSLLQMVWIFILAGAFAASAKAMGSVDATVYFILNILPAKFILAGLFLSACIISLAIGTSVGTIIALVPIASGLSHVLGVDEPLILGLVIGGAFFGDNLSFISDTTIAATSSQGCSMKDKFKVNSLIVVPAAICILIIYTIIGHGLEKPTELPRFNYIYIIPYLVVILMALRGFNVMIVLIVGIIFSGSLGLYAQSYNLYGWFATLGGGMTSMGELIIVTMLAGGLLAIIKHNGGIHYIIAILTKFIKGKRGAELSIGLLVSFVNICTANNTIAIITVGNIAKQISKKFEINSRKSASILDTFSCAIQGILPYGAQILMAAGLTKVSPIEIVGYTYYPIAIALMALFSILIRYPKKYS